MERKQNRGSDGKQTPYVKDNMIVLPKKPADYPLGYQDENGNVHRFKGRYLRMTKNIRPYTI